MPKAFIILIAVFGGMAILIVVRMGIGLARWIDNNRQPILAVRARLVQKRLARSIAPMELSGGGSTKHFGTFELESGEQRRYRIDRKTYRRLAEGDDGTLTFQGRRFLGFVRNGP